MKISKEELSLYQGKKVLITFTDKGDIVKYVGHLKFVDDDKITLISNYGASEISIDAITKIRVLEVVDNEN